MVWDLGLAYHTYHTNPIMKNYLHEHVWVSSKAAGVSGLNVRLRLAQSGLDHRAGISPSPRVSP